MDVAILAFNSQHEAVKKEANELYSAHKYAQAVEKYSVLIDLVEKHIFKEDGNRKHSKTTLEVMEKFCILLNNRALAHGQVGNYR